MLSFFIFTFHRQFPKHLQNASQDTKPLPVAFQEIAKANPPIAIKRKTTKQKQ